MNYRPRLTSIRDVADRDFPAPRDADGRIVTDPDACRELLFAVLETAIRDYEFMLHVEREGTASVSQEKRRDAILEDGDPREFFQDAWFSDICYFLGLDPASIIDLLESRSPSSRFAQAS